MALLDMSRKQGVYLEAAHMNYHHRDTANRDENIVRNYCRKHKIRFHKADFHDEEYKGNFQNNARIARYAFFKEICNKNSLDEVLVAHNLDDFLETYLMQKEKNIGVSYLGIKERNVIDGVNIYRPLLNYEKKKLEEYCIENNVRFGIDETNLLNGYTRNRIRHETVEKLSSIEKRKLYKDIKNLNKERENKINDAEKYLKGSSFETDYFLACPDLVLYMHRHFPDKSEKSVNEMLRQIKESGHCIFRGKDVLISKEYGFVNITDPVKEYEFVFNDPDDIEFRKYGPFKISSKGTGFEGVTVKKDDFPITIRNYRPGDRIEMTYGRKGINRYFIDKKMRYYDRMMYPVVLNVCQNVILVPGIGCDIKHYSKKHNFFVIKL